MSEGLATTLRLLEKTDNEAALAVLRPALDAPNPVIREGALRAILRRRNPTGVPEILRRLDRLSDHDQAILRENPGRMTSALRDAVLGNDLELCRTACRAAVMFQEYDLIPTLINAMEDAAKPNAAPAAETLMHLAHALYDELAAPRDYRNRRDPQLVRRNVLSSLELSLKRYARHERREAVEAFVLLVNRDNVVLKSILQNPHNSAFLVVNDVLSKGEHGGVLRLLLSFLDDPHAPSAGLSVVANRSDLRFLRFLLRKIGREPSALVGQNLKRIESVPWLRNGERLLDELDDIGQHGAVRLAIGCALPRAQAFAVIEYLLLHGKPGGRREAARALADFTGADANALALTALDDSDPQVQANVLGQLRRRGIPGVLARVVEKIDSRHAMVRKAARESLAEFSFARFLGAFDMLDEEVRQSTGLLVRKIDPQTPQLLRQELESPVRSRRLRGLAVARATELVGQFEDLVIELLNDEDHMVRAEAVTALGALTSEASLAALDAACDDRSPVVQEAARQARQQRPAANSWRAAINDPRD